MDLETSAAIWNRLSLGKSLDGFGLSRRNGRLDLSDLQVPESASAGTRQSKLAEVKGLIGLTEIRNATWQGLDFAGTKLGHLRFHETKVIDCIFDDCRCQDWRVWKTEFVRCSFRAADLRSSALGPVQDNRQNRFVSVDFTGTDLRRTSYQSAVFTGCAFRNAQLDKVDFQGSCFKDCVFEGELRETLFYNLGFRQEHLPPNQMAHVDFSRASLHSVEFRRLDMAEVKWPADDRHVIIEDYPATLDRMLARLSQKDDPASRGLRAYLGVLRKWAGPRQRCGVVNLHEISDLLGDKGGEIFLTTLRA
jgi:uncharacterized protein YjbI with pentapeptide repeats